MSTLSLPFRDAIQSSQRVPSLAVGLSIRCGLARLIFALEVRRQRRALLALDDRMLSDIGIGRSEAFREADRGVFDLPGRD